MAFILGVSARSIDPDGNLIYLARCLTMSLARTKISKEIALLTYISKFMVLQWDFILVEPQRMNAFSTGSIFHVVSKLHFINSEVKIPRYKLYVIGNSQFTCAQSEDSGPRTI